jgi:hypothetical protein
MLFKEADVIVAGKCARSVGKDRSNLNKSQSEVEEELEVMSLVMSAFSLELVCTSEQTGLTVLTSTFSSAVSACSTTASATVTGIAALEICMLKNELMEGVPTAAASIFRLFSALF